MVQFGSGCKTEENGAWTISNSGTRVGRKNTGDWLLYLALENHKAQGLLQCVSQIRSKIGFSYVFKVNVKSLG